MSHGEMTATEIRSLERQRGLRVHDHRNLFDFVNTVQAKRGLTASLDAVTKYRGTNACMIHDVSVNEPPNSRLHRQPDGAAQVHSRFADRSTPGR